MAEQTNTVDIQSNVVEEFGKTTSQIETKHPLQNEWDFWYFKPNKNAKQNWQDNLLKIHSFSTVEDFWALYNHIELPSRLNAGSDYNLFKSGIKPMWEDPRNKQGGRLVILFKKASIKEGYQRDLKMLEDKIWLETCLCLIGETFGEQSDKICGLVFNSRQKMDRISIWTSDWQDQEGIFKIALTLKERTKFNDKMLYEKHVDDKMPKSLYSI